ncbi:MAG TPA: DUF4998 domain-containing protein [Prolixibacteraceae bacterium]|nr:DUF4998 domain-containing protein [Prolixibacteraceae bacterium]
MKISNIYIVSIVLLAIFVQSCTKMNDLHQPYLDEGEIIYAAKVDSVAAKAGKGRIELEMLITAQRIETVRIFWNDYTDSLDVAIDNQTGDVSKFIENLPEKGYIFQFVSIDQFGNKSLPFEVTGSVYGDIFQTIITNRQIKSISELVDGKITITWQSAVDNGVRCDLNYINAVGVEVTRKVPMTESTTTLTDLASGLNYRTLFIPEPNAIDTFYTETVTPTVISVTEISLLNPGDPFVGKDVSGRWGNLADWTVNDAAKNHGGIGGFDNLNNGSGFLSMEYWGTPAIVNGKIYQTLTLPAGSYSFVATVSSIDRSPDAIYVTAAIGETLPDIDAIGTALAKTRIIDNSQNGKDVSASFVLTETTTVSVGFSITMLVNNETSVRIKKIRLIRRI